MQMVVNVNGLAASCPEPIEEAASVFLRHLCGARNNRFVAMHKGHLNVDHDQCGF